MPPASDATPETEFRVESFRGVPGFFRVAQDASGRWWLIDAHDRAFFCKAVHDVRASPAEAAGASESSAAPFAAANADPAARLRRWGFNTVGAGGDGAGRDDGLAFFASADFCRAGPLIHAHGARLPDVFAPDWPQLATAHALAMCAPLATNRALLGWLTDDAANWAQPRPNASRPTLLQICLSLEPGFAAYHAAWEFTLALHGGKLAALARAWGTPLANKEVVRELTRAEQGIASRGYGRDCARWTREFARRYFTGAAAAIRAADPHHLVLGCRGVGAAEESVRAEEIFPAVDVPLVAWDALPAVGGVAPGPVLADDVGWTDEHFFGPAAGLRRLTAVERMLRRGRVALERAARHPAVTGFVWRQWLDEPGEQPPFARGLVHRNGAEAREHTELLAEFNARAESLRRAARPGVAAEIVTP